MGAVFNNNWYDLNSTRPYPLDDAATGTGDDGERLPQDVLVDAQVRFPSTLCARAAVSSVVVGPALVSVTLVGVPESGDAFIPLGAVTVRRPIQPGRPYPIAAMSAGVGGYLVFGDGIDQSFRARFAAPGQGLLAPRAARSYRPLPVESVGKLGSTVTLDGLVLVRGDTDVEVVAEDRSVGGRNREVIVVRLRQDATQNLLDTYKGPCGGRPESGTCNAPAVEYINTVGPDCNGNLTIRFGAPLRPAYFVGGVAVDYPYGLIDACTRDDRLPDPNGKLPNEYNDECNPSSEGDQDANALPPPPLPPTVPRSSSSVSSSIAPEAPPGSEAPGPTSSATPSSSSSLVPGSESSLSSIVYDCEACPDGAAFEYEVTFDSGTGVFEGINGVWRFRHTGTCFWGAGPQGGWSGQFRFRTLPSSSNITFTDGLGNTAVYKINGDLCCGPFTLSLATSTGSGTTPSSGPLLPVGLCPAGTSSGTSSVAPEESSAYREPSISSAFGACQQLPYVESWSSGIPEDFQVILGSFVVVDEEGPADPGDLPSYSYHSSTLLRPGGTELTRELLGYYRFEDNLLDSSGNDRHLVDPVPGVYCNGRLNKGFGANVTGGNPAESDDPYAPGVDWEADGFTVAGWFRWNSKTNSGDMLSQVVLRDLDLNFDAFIGIFSSSGGSALAYWQTAGFGVSGSAIAQDTWVHLALTWDGTTVRCYRDGSLFFSHTTSPSAQYEQLLVSPADGGGEGRIDEVGVWGRKLDTDEIVRLYANHDGYDPTIRASSASALQSSWIENLDPLNPDAALQSSQVGRNVILWNDCACDPATQLRLTTDLMVPTGSSTGSAGIVANFKPAMPDPGNKYWQTEIDIGDQVFRVRFWDGAAWSTFTSVPAALSTNRWYRIRFDITGVGAYFVVLSDVLLGEIAAASGTFAGYMPADGRVGLGTQDAGALFSYFKVEAI